ncbi:MAG TPA: class E sortase [Solirubrobacteraceae bacterium]|nr:class E sortase [Solirubrobacteraceae bacterium]
MTAADIVGVERGHRGPALSLGSEACTERDGMPEILLTTSSPHHGSPPRRDGEARAHARTRARALRLLACLMIALGALALLDAGVTLIWQEPISALYAMFRQDALSGDLHALEHTTPTRTQQRALASLHSERARVAFLAAELQRHTSNGSPVGRIVIPRIGASYVVVNGTDTEDLMSGPGVYSDTNFPGIPGTTAIAGHRTTYLAPFRDIELLRRGNRIVLKMPYARFTYRVTGQRVVLPTDVSAAIAQVGYSRLVLSACTPLFSAEKRLLVYARLARIVPVGAARKLPGNPIVRPIESSTAASSRPDRQALPAMLESLQPQGLTPLV